MSFYFTFEIPFSINLWIRAESEPCVFLTVANLHRCQLVIRVQPVDNWLVLYLANATATGAHVNIIAPGMPSFACVNVAFAWSSPNRALLYM